ncbi:carboxylate--amine ligase/circularly permuted type 2 ATP-grasp protein [Nakamurella endophytica]|uniref:Putative glutamate--cysteine ligase 2 n=1 Tax=Nakamurella endophytica TaxID=1748367 RepID=A0A917SSR1_9ACTN|nr:carboxylate--amine ligase/circularly permuted type 2 ATP-grasp protein [Nakamurella endophytica]GGL93169.1 hypothetical protein GCM10011594_11260 [Nakamurella endophytica]
MVAAAFTLGAEEELHLVDPETCRLAPRAPQLLAQLPAESFGAELQRTTVETNTGVWDTLGELRADIEGLRGRLIEAAARDGLQVAAVGTPPLSSEDDFELTASGRFGRMQQDYRLLVDEQLICGLQVHVGLADRDVAVDVTQRIMPDLPLLLALSASSPYWRGEDTGYSSIRTIIWQRWPTAGATGPLASAAEYDTLLADLIASGVIADAKMAYFDVRPSAHAPTVELRVTDACPLVDDAVLIAGLFRAMVATAERAHRIGDPYQVVPAPLHRAAMWRAARSGLTGDLLSDDRRPQPVPAAVAIRRMIARLRPALEDFGDLDTVGELAEATLARGNSADRQRAALAERGELRDVVALVVAETAGRVTSEGRMAPRRYPARAGDEAFTAGGHARPAYRPLFEALGTAGLEQLVERRPDVDRWTLDAGMTFGVDGRQLPFPVDLLPRVVPAHEWAALVPGLAQRARALESFLRDAYGPARIVADGVLSAEALHGCPGWRAEAARLPDGVVRAPVMGFDLVRTETGGWLVLEDNVRVPSGVAYALALRRAMDELAPDLPRPPGLLDPATVPALLGRTLRACARGVAPADARVALLSDGAGNSAWFEHRMLAEQAGLTLVTPDQVAVGGGRVRGPDGEPFDVLYLRLDTEPADLTDGAGRPVGAEVLEVAVRGGVALANAPGNGLADDKAMYCSVPDLVAHYLDERPLLPQVPTYRCADPEELRLVLERVGELVTKPISGYGGRGVLIGPSASAAEVSVRRREIAQDPAEWVAQEVVALSSHPTAMGGEVLPRHVDLRVFAYVTGTGPDDVAVAPLGLTRVAPQGSMVVNSSRGGGAKDTWILGGDASAGA